jgi:hypothetical protein
LVFFEFVRGPVDQEMFTVPMLTTTRPCVVRGCFEG